MKIGLARIFLISPLLLSIGTSSHAQSSLDLSGYLDIGTYKNSSNSIQLGTIQRSNLALSGSGDLGDGNAAIFRLSTRFDLNTGSTEDGPNSGKPFWHDEATLGLKSTRLGTLRFGRALDALYAVDWQFDPWYNFDRVASPAWDMWHYNYPSDPFADNGKADYGRLNDGIFYDSPTFEGLQVHLSGSPDSRKSTETNRPIAGSLVYSGSLFQGIVAHAKNSVGDTDTEFGLKTSIQGLSLMGVFDKSVAGSSTARTGTLGAAYTQGSFTYKAGLGQLRLNGSNAERMASLGTVYAFNKGTSVYVEAARKRFTSDSVTVWGIGISQSLDFPKTF